MKKGDRVRSKKTRLTGTLARPDEHWPYDWVVATDQPFQSASGMLVDGFAANESELELLDSR